MPVSASSLLLLILRSSEGVALGRRWAISCVGDNMTCLIPSFSIKTSMLLEICAVDCDILLLGATPRVVLCSTMVRRTPAHSATDDMELRRTEPAARRRFVGCAADKKGCVRAFRRPQSVSSYPAWLDTVSSSDLDGLPCPSAAESRGYQRR